MRVFATVMVVVLGALSLTMTQSLADSSFTLRSPAFEPNGTIPHQFSYRGHDCDGANESPPLRWKGAPRSTRSFALTVFDPDARGEGWWHWIVFDLPPATASLPTNAGSAGEQSLPRPALSGMTSFHSVGYGGPCPPDGDAPHHYIFTLYALDTAVLRGANNRTEGPDLLRMLEGHVLAKAVLIGRFGRP